MSEPIAEPAEPEPGSEPAGEPGTEPAEPAEPTHDGDEPNADDALESAIAAEMGDDGEPAAGDDADAHEPPPEQPSQAEIEATYKKLDAETARHVKRVAELVGEEAFRHLVACELCEPSIPGFRWPRPPADEVKEAVRYAIGDRQPENWQPDQYSRACEACAGLGEVLTGSRVRGQDTLACIPCEGKGWIPIGNERTGRPAVTLRAIEGTDPQPPAPAAPLEDPPEVAALKAQGYVVIRPAGSE